MKQNFLVWLFRDFFGGLFDVFSVFRRPKTLFNVLLVAFSVSFLLSYKLSGLERLNLILGISIFIVYIWKKWIVFNSERKHNMREGYKEIKVED